jgi:hypothetical protein
MTTDMESAHYYFDAETMTQYVHAVRTISPGEEVLINCKSTVAFKIVNLDSMLTTH